MVKPSIVNDVPEGYLALPVAGMIVVAVFSVPPASEPLIAPVSALSRIIQHFSTKKVCQFLAASWSSTNFTATS